MFGVWKARAVPINVNYRYVEAELAYLFDNADLVALVHGREFVPRIAAVRDDRAEAAGCSSSIEDGTDEDLATIGAVEYEAALAAASPTAHPGPAQPRRPLHALHRRHHRHAEGRDVAPGGLLPLHHRRARWRAAARSRRREAVVEARRTAARSSASRSRR